MFGVSAKCVIVRESSIIIPTQGSEFYISTLPSLTLAFKEPLATTPWATQAYHIEIEVDRHA